MTAVAIKKELHGSILDIGGGGEGVVGRIYGRQATAIDSSAEELAEAPDGPVKLVMDACGLEFADGSFDNATAFFSFIYIAKDKHKAAAAEIARVLRDGGSFDLWDCALPASADREPFIIELDIDAAGERLHTCYGVAKQSPEQDAAYFEKLFGSVGLSVTGRQTAGDTFHIIFRKGRRES